MCQLHFPLTAGLLAMAILAVVQSQGTSPTSTAWITEPDTGKCFDDLKAKIEDVVNKDGTVRDKMCGWREQHAICVARLTDHVPNSDEVVRVHRLMEKYILDRGEQGIVCSYERDEILRKAREGDNNAAGSTYKQLGVQGWLLYSMGLLITFLIVRK